MSAEYENGGVLRYRVEQYGKRLDRADDRQREIERKQLQLEGRLTNVEDVVERIEKKVDSLQTRSTTILVSIVTGCIGMMLTILAGTGKL